MKSIIVIVIAFVLLIPINLFGYIEDKERELLIAKNTLVEYEMEKSG